LETLLGILLQELHERLHATLRDAGHPDLTRSHLVLFQHLPPQGDRLTNLAESAQLTKQSMGYLADFLESRGYLVRVPDPRDRRAHLIRLTTRGLEVEHIARQTIAAATTEWAEYVGQARMEEFQATLQLLVDRLTSSRPPHHAPVPPISV
jgi:DNA-binding MarR family transcriptional regulator